MKRLIKKGEYRAIAGGGRYDNLVKLISGGKVDLPALGFGMGDVVLLELLRERGLLPRFDGQVQAYCLIEDEALREPSLDLVQHLRERGFAVEFPLGAGQIRQTIQTRAGASSGIYLQARNLAARRL